MAMGVRLRADLRPGAKLQRSHSHLWSRFCAKSDFASQLIADAFVKVKIKTRLRRKHTFMLYTHKYEQSGVALTKKILHLCASWVRRADHRKRWSFIRLRPDGGKLLQVRSESNQSCALSRWVHSKVAIHSHTQHKWFWLLSIVSIFTTLSLQLWPIGGRVRGHVASYTTSQLTR